MIERVQSNVASTAASATGRIRLPRRQQGVVLFIALIALVAMTLAGIAMIRSVDTTLGISGNIAFRQTATQSTDQGIQAAVAWLNANAAGTTLQNTDLTQGYRASYGGEPPLGWFDINSFSSAIVLNSGNADVSGNVVRYVIERMCANTGTYAPPNSCATDSPQGATGTGGSLSVGAPGFGGLPLVYFRVTARVDGPRNTVAITQASIQLPGT